MVRDESEDVLQFSSSSLSHLRLFLFLVFVLLELCRGPILPLLERPNALGLSLESLESTDEDPPVSTDSSVEGVSGEGVDEVGDSDSEREEEGASLRVVEEDLGVGTRC